MIQRFLRSLRQRVSFRLVLFCVSVFTFIVGKVEAQIPWYSITLSKDKYEELYSRDAFSDEYLQATFEANGTTWKDAEVRFKGNSKRFFPKKSFRVRFPHDRLFNNVHDLNLHAMYTDKSMLREKLAWDLFADMHVIAPRASYAHLVVNNHNMGLYLAVDKIDKQFLHQYGIQKCSLYEAAGLYSLADMTVQSEDALKLYYSKEVGDKNDYRDLQELLKIINTVPDTSFARVVDSLFAINSIVDWFAGNILMMMGDSYNKNYLLCRDPAKLAHQWTVIPWDYDEAFGLSGDPAVVPPQSLLNEGFAYSFPPLSGPWSILKERFWNTPALREMLRQRVDTLLQTVFTEEKFFPRIDSLADLIRNEVATDSMKWGTMEEFRYTVETVKYFITARRNYLLKTFVNPPSGEFNLATVVVKAASVPYDFVGRDGRQLATVTFSEIQSLDSIRVEAFPDSTPPNIVYPESGKYVKRWVRVTPFPKNAVFTATLQWMYHDVSSKDREVQAGVSDERALRCFAFDGKSLIELLSTINPVANTVSISSITSAQCKEGMYFMLQVP
jgi:spore coat protein H